MENATKALLIAAAVLIAILIISLGLVVYNSSAETVKQANLSSQEVSTANEKFTRYNGTHKRGSEGNPMLNTVLSLFSIFTLVTVPSALTVNLTVSVDKEYPSGAFSSIKIYSPGFNPSITFGLSVDIQLYS